jgi:K+-sensing histidine kinase KdpD
VSTYSIHGKSLARAGGNRQPLRRRTDPQEADYRYLRKIRAKNDDNWIQIHFADNGMGIAEKDQERVFDPFFTTKEVGKGTGLGLSVSIRIIETLGGRMELKSSPGEETIVSILLPLAEEKSAGDSRQQAGKE